MPNAPVFGLPARPGGALGRQAGGARGWNLVGCLAGLFVVFTGCGGQDSGRDEGEADAGALVDAPADGVEGDSDGGHVPDSGPSDVRPDARVADAGDVDPDAADVVDADAVGVDAADVESDVDDADADAEDVSGRPIIVGVEYITIENAVRHAAVADHMRPTGLTAAKPLPANFDWGTMAPTPDAAPDTARLDAFVRVWQARGYEHLELGLRSYSTWGSKDWGRLGGTNPTPKPEHMDAFAAWVQLLVERYDMDGEDDMEGLRYPIRHFEIGVEFSSFEPEPVDDYLEMLGVAYRAAHAASDDVLVAHAAFFTYNVFRDDPPRGVSYEEAFASARVQNADGTYRGGIRSLADMRAVLARPDLFDVINLHALADPYEIEGLVEWLGAETDGVQGYPKPILISDTTTEPFVSLGWATTCDAPSNARGILIHPATEDDRCRLADYFTALVEGDPDTVAWVRAFAAADLVKKVVVAAEQGIGLINVWSVEDIPILQAPAIRGSGGNTAWGGLIRPFGPGFGQVERYAGWYALQLLLEGLAGATGVRRLDVGDPAVRVYELSDGRHVAWRQRVDLLLPGDSVEPMAASLPGSQYAQAPSTAQPPTWTDFDGTLDLTPTPTFLR